MKEHNNKKAGRPQKFEREQVLDKLLHLFWMQGYEGTSIAEIVKCAGINPPTLYASFGSKDQVFALVMERYVSQYLSQVIASIETPGLSVPARLELFLTRFVEVITQPGYPRGCMLLFELFTYHKKPPTVFAGLSSAGFTFFNAFCTLVAQGIERGEIRGAGTPQETATLILAFEKGLAMQAKAGSDRDMLLHISRQFVQMLTR
ncbi:MULTISPECIES: TetR/AcrR family transcriptional regulator [Edwardsiella]|uniref:Transcriptional regulator, TetR family n=2 Tax=Edwardsiella anguillarum TaxID=1821960 RepID=A0A076LIC6_9GAMM|nr:MULTISPECIES: TetR/AcrR family transcriptional regulator [Edwardsiella]AKM47521.1 TetR family transcriptional regulator [Edwardsiella sp. EA181011]GAJ66223.1 regulatory protein TetR [Edwardsiella piscicida]AIJ06657.1 transcriptional regulator, TetR family [Edwardsiella anguillarum ET080813]AKR78174.1 TetR/AcrR family transcriptional regulator [Edwardsiella sp. LADL05-105]KAB0593291.1 TetR/AcrR family transcriptional regulator [Edwardsiella anguillarum]